MARATGVSGGSADIRLESYCNSVAGEMLLPEPEMNELRFLRRAPLHETIRGDCPIREQAEISRAMVAYKLLRVNFIAQTRWRELDKHYEDEWICSSSAVST